nr:MAG TPA: hypothetical protein [Caudoviricetes sp.]
MFFTGTDSSNSCTHACAVCPLIFMCPCSIL